MPRPLASPIDDDFEAVINCEIDAIVSKNSLTIFDVVEICRLRALLRQK